MECNNQKRGENNMAFREIKVDGVTVTAVRKNFGVVNNGGQPLEVFLYRDEENNFYIREKELTTEQRYKDSEVFHTFRNGKLAGSYDWVHGKRLKNITDLSALPDVVVSATNVKPPQA